MLQNFAVFTPDLTILTDAAAALALIVAAVVLGYSAKLAFPVVRSVYRFASRLLS